MVDNIMMASAGRGGAGLRGDQYYPPPPPFPPSMHLPFSLSSFLLFRSPSLSLFLSTSHDQPSLRLPLGLPRRRYHLHPTNVRFLSPFTAASRSRLLSASLSLSLSLIPPSCEGEPDANSHGYGRIVNRWEARKNVTQNVKKLQHERLVSRVFKRISRYEFTR